MFSLNQAEDSLDDDFHHCSVHCFIWHVYRELFSMCKISKLNIAVVLMWICDDSNSLNVIYHVRQVHETFGPNWFPVWQIPHIMYLKLVQLYFKLLSDLHLERHLVIYLFVYMCCTCVCGFFFFFCVVLSSPLTKIATCSLLVPMRFLTSQTKVVLTASSTFSTFRSLSVICTVSGIAPDILQGRQNVYHEIGEKDKIKERLDCGFRAEQLDRCTEMSCTV